MGQKDVAFRMLAEYADVFADIVNVLLFHGRRVVRPEDLAAAMRSGEYKAEDGLHELERDVAKTVDSQGVTIALIGLEHQTKADQLMPVRIVGYDGLSYRAQLLKHKDSERVYPVVTIVLYFGVTRWSYGRRLSDVVEVPDGWEHFVADYEMRNLFEIAFLPQETIDMFTSDFRVVAECLRQKRLKGHYEGGSQEIQHVDELFKLLSVIMSDERFNEVAAQIREDERRTGRKEKVTMDTALDYIENKGREEGRAEGRREGELSGMVRVYATELGYTPEQIAGKLNLPADVVKDIIAAL